MMISKLAGVMGGHFDLAGRRLYGGRARAQEKLQGAAS